MAILTPCSCGVIYNLRNEFSGKYLICSECSAQLYVPCIDKAITENSLHVFDDATYFLRKNHFSISTKYSVRNSTGNEILFIERPTKYIFRIFLLIITYMLLVGSAKSMPILIPVIIVAFYCINIKRDIKIYDNKEKETLLLEIRQNDWLQKKWLRYTLYDHRGPMLGYFDE
jgi:hypothetical protein